MKPMTCLLLAALLPAGLHVAPALAQSAACTPEHAAMGHCTLPPPATPPPATATAKSACTPEHAAMGHCTLPKPATAPKPAPKPAPKAIPKADPKCPPEHAAMGHCTPATAQRPAAWRPLAAAPRPQDRQEGDA